MPRVRLSHTRFFAFAGPVILGTRAKHLGNIKTLRNPVHSLWIICDVYALLLSDGVEWWTSKCGGDRTHEASKLGT
jgi:hypothetical protein